jgi:hypothetical protein
MIFKDFNMAGKRGFAAVYGNHPRKANIAPSERLVDGACSVRSPRRTAEG